MRFQRLGVRIGGAIPRSRVRILRSPKECNKVEEGDIVVVKDPLAEYAAIVNRCSAIIADTGNDTCHLAIALRERNKPGWFGTGNATEVLRDSNEFLLPGSADTDNVAIIKHWEFSGRISHEMAEHMIDRERYDDG